MQINTFRKGDRVMVTAKDDFYAFIDGWRGRVGSRAGVPAGYERIECADMDDGVKSFVVPCDELALVVGH